MKLISIFSGWNLNEAEIIRSRLEAANFHPVIVNEYVANLFGGSANAISPIFVQVPEEESVNAREFLDTP